MEFAGNIGAMSFNGAVTDEKFFADFLAGFVFGDQFQNALFGRREQMQAGLFPFKFFGAATTI